MNQTPQPIERLHRPTPETLGRDYIFPNKPVVITGVANQWPAVSRWSPEYFKSSFGDELVKLRGGYGGDSSNELGVDLKNTGGRVPLGNFIDSMRSASHPKNSALAFPVFKHLPQLRGDIESLEPYMNMPSYCPQGLRRRLQLEPKFFLGPAGYGSALHFDDQNNFYVQVYGRKKFIMVSPKQSELVYYPLDYPNTNFSPVDVAQPDLDRFPLFQKATLQEVVVEAGEMLFIPVRWWHYVIALEESMSLSFWWTSASVTLRLCHPFFVSQKGKLVSYLKRQFGGR
jgi:lysine-specific demethylase 8